MHLYVILTVANQYVPCIRSCIYLYSVTPNFKLLLVKSVGFGV